MKTQKVTKKYERRKNQMKIIAAKKLRRSPPESNLESNY